jgi:ring-1,2-phenylacetyl-CoA epoxidase subunit PaaC
MTAHDAAHDAAQDAVHDNAYAGLLGDADPHWAFGTGFTDPLAGVGPAVPSDVDRADLAAYCLMLGDDALVLAQRLSHWCSRAPDLEEDIALANVALDLLGQARLLLARAAVVDPSVLPPSVQAPEDALAYFRPAKKFRNVLLVEGVDVDFADAVVRLLLFSVHRLAVLDRLTGSRDAVLAAVAAKGVKEVAYHRDHAARWVVTLARGTDESRRRVLAALDRLWPLVPELTAAHPVERRVAAAGAGVDPSAVEGETRAVLDEVFAAAGLPRPAGPLRRTAGADPADAGAAGQVAPGGIGDVLTPLAPAGLAEAEPRGRDGRHTPALGQLLAEMQEVARAHPEGTW